MLKELSPSIQFFMMSIIILIMIGFVASSDGHYLHSPRTSAPFTLTRAPIRHPYSPSETSPSYRRRRYSDSSPSSHSHRYDRSPTKGPSRQTNSPVDRRRPTNSSYRHHSSSSSSYHSSPTSPSS